MQQISTLLSKGKSSRELIDLGYAPGTVYKVQRKYRQGNGTLQSSVSSVGKIAQVDQSGGFDRINLDKRGISSWVWHPSPPTPCLDCGVNVAHWDLCPHCDRFVPSDCDCVEGSRAHVAGFGLNELLDGASRTFTRTLVSMPST